MTSEAHPTDPDSDLLHAARGGDRTACSALLAGHYKTCLRIAQSVLRNRADAEDEVQNSFVQAFLHLNRFEGNSRFSSWLGRIVINQCLMRLRKVRRAPLVALEIEPADEAQTAESRWAHAEMAAVLSREVRRMPPLLRQPLLLREAEGLSLSAVASRLSVTEAAAKSRLLRARRELRNRMERHMGWPGG